MSAFPDMDLFRRHLAEGYPLPSPRFPPSTPQETDVNLTDPMRNSFGDTVQFQQVIAGTEQRVADAQVRLGNIEDKINALTAAVASLHADGQVDGTPALDALATKVADLLAVRLAS